ncbi:MAG: L-2-hydroxyglutarate oxidase [Solirubrobacteraceae bacterium]|nr:L-2-hydroxyglutarate oxidase [Solirubrobacteraceae bacterium]
MKCVVVGGGILGIATARQLALARPGDEVMLLEREPELALHQTARNSGVIHAGVYYPPGSLKARLCRRGAELMIGYCEANGLPLELCGKVVVALDEHELPRLDELERRATANGVPGLRRVDTDGLRAIEPHAAGIAALHSPRTAITDFAAVARAMATELEAAGGKVRTGADVVRMDGGHNASVVLADGERVAADRVIVCAGLRADRLARASGAADAPRIVPFRGEYYVLAPHRRSEVRGLIYPVPDPALPFLGIHLTRRVDGAVLVGPNAVPALALEGYDRHTRSVGDLADLARWPGGWRLARRQWRTGLSELRRSRSVDRFVAAAARYLPGLTAADVEPAPAGVRAQAVDRDGSLVDDFRLEHHGAVTWVRNAPSPAATSSLALAEELIERAGLAG